MNDHSLGLIRSFHGWFRVKDPSEILFQSRRFTWKGPATSKEKIHQKNPWERELTMTVVNILYAYFNQKQSAPACKSSSWMERPRMWVMMGAMGTRELDLGQRNLLLPLANLGWIYSQIPGDVVKERSFAMRSSIVRTIATFCLDE
jgi:hypothetical protein